MTGKRNSRPERPKEGEPVHSECEKLVYMEVSSRKAKNVHHLFQILEPGLLIEYQGAYLPNR